MQIIALNPILTKEIIELVTDRARELGMYVSLLKEGTTLILVDVYKDGEFCIQDNPNRKVIFSHLDFTEALDLIPFLVKMKALCKTID